jgi:prevent-host-death family protein
MKDISATEAGRNFSELLDAVEHRHESFVVVRKGRSIARIVPESGTSGSDVKQLLRAHRADPAWAKDLRELRSILEGEDRWNG